jgi:hypothetical protein
LASRHGTSKGENAVTFFDQVGMRRLPSNPVPPVIRILISTSLSLRASRSIA